MPDAKQAYLQCDVVLILQRVI